MYVISYLRLTRMLINKKKWVPVEHFNDDFPTFPRNTQKEN